MSHWPPRSEDGFHGATFEWDGPWTAVSCICGFYRIAESHEVAEREYMNHFPEQQAGFVSDHPNRRKQP